MNNTVAQPPQKNYNKSILENKVSQQVLQDTRQKFKIDELTLDPNKPNRPETAKSQITTFDRKVMKK